MVSKDYQTAHPARVVGLSEKGFLVEITPEVGHDCGGCALSHFCSGSRGQKMTVHATLDKGLSTPSVGDRVTVVAEAGTHTRAALLLLVVPLLVLLVVAVVMSHLCSSELAVGLSAIACSALSYFLIYLLTRRQAPRWIMVKDVN